MPVDERTFAAEVAGWVTEVLMIKWTVCPAPWPH